MSDEATNLPYESTSENLKYPPAEKCIFCNKKIEEIGGSRIIAQKLRGVILSTKPQSGGKKDTPRQSYKLDDKTDRYVVVWGEKELWTASAIERARNEFLSKHSPWYCQICGARKCSKCNSPINYPMGSDILDEDGYSSHCAIFPVNPGCSNKECEEYKEWKTHQKDS
tara:strand:+ start:7586 stop:8089 length:504 start_codon:yes stop_codon:yes gene_type:complete